MKDFQDKLVAAWTDYVAGKIDAKALKGASAGFGIYQQRDDKTMMRIRRVGGLVTTDDLRNVAGILSARAGGYAHLTTRQDIQLHGIPAENVTAALEDCETKGFPFRGGGGDTFRNTRTSCYSGLRADSVFDVVPYAKSLSNAFYAFDLAYGLPRKLKIGFADGPSEAYVAQSNDLGFLAKVVDGQRVFETYLAGGIGFKPQLGIKIFDALPVEDCIRAAMALTALFNDKGCRTNRAHARIRFLCEDFGDEGLVQLFHAYYEKTTDAPKAVPAEVVARPETAFPVDAPKADGFEVWKALAVSPLANGLAAVRICVPFGNLTAAELVNLANALDTYGATRLEIIPTLDFGLVVPENQLAGVHAALAALPGVDYVLRSFVGNVRTCIGCTVCKSGITDAPSIGRKVAEYFDAKYRPLDTSEKIAVARALLNDVSISGCPNSCTTQQLMKLGFSGRKLDGADAETTYSAGSISPAALGAADTACAAIPVEDFPAHVEKAILGLLR